jgi:hypothetical protein
MDAASVAGFLSLEGDIIIFKYLFSLLCKSHGYTIRRKKNNKTIATPNTHHGGNYYLDLLEG